MAWATKVNGGDNWVKMTGAREFGATTRVSKAWKTTDKRRFRAAFHTMKGKNRIESLPMELFMSDNAKAMATGVAFALSALTLM